MVRFVKNKEFKNKTFKIKMNNNIDIEEYTNIKMIYPNEKIFLLIIHLQIQMLILLY